MKDILYKKLNVRISQWDPLDIGMPIALSEYLDYVPKIYKSIIENNKLKEVLIDILNQDLSLDIDVNDYELNKDIDILIKDLQEIVKYT